MTTDSDGTAPASAEDFQRLEARLNARIQEILASLVLHDGRFAALTDRVNQHDRRAAATAARADARFDAADHRFDRTDARIGMHSEAIATWQKELTDELRHHLQALRRTTLIGLAVTTATTSSMCLLTVLITR